LHLREDRFIAALDRRPAREKRAAAGMEGRIGVVGTVGPIDAGEHRLEGVVVALRNRIELVVVAAGAVDGEALEGTHDRHHVVVAIEVLRHEMVDGVFADADHERVVPGASSEEAEGRNRLRLVGKENVAGHLLGDESTVGLVVVEGADHPVAVRPGVGAGVVVIVAVGVGVVGGVEPVAGEMFPVPRRGEELFDRTAGRAVDAACGTLSSE
jgi:hypothetical protein